MVNTPVHYGKGMNPRLSNFWPSTVRFRGRTFACAEGAYQAYKSGVFIPGYENLGGAAAKNKAKKQNLVRASDAFVIGLMDEILQARFEQDTEFRLALAAAGSITHPVGDSFWREWFPRLMNRLKERMNNQG